MAEETKYIAELEPDLWLAPWCGDPGRTKKVENARIFNNMSTAWRAIEKGVSRGVFQNKYCY